MLRSYVPSPATEASPPMLQAGFTAHTGTLHRFLDLPVEIQSKICDAYCSQKFSIFMSGDVVSGKAYISGPRPPPLLFTNHEIMSIAHRSWLGSFSGTLTLGDRLTEKDFNRKGKLFAWLMNNVTCLQTFPHGEPIDRHFLWSRMPKLKHLEVIKHLETKYVLQCFDTALSKHKSAIEDKVMEKWGIKIVIDQQLETLIGNGYGNVTFAMRTDLLVPNNIHDTFWKQSFIDLCRLLARIQDRTFW